MPRVSRSKLHKEKLEEITKHFSFLISSLRDSKEIENFLDEFLTQEEKIMLTKRLVLLMMLQRNYPPPVIQSVLHISYETVRIYQNQLPLKTDLFRKTIERLVTREKAKEFFRKLDKFLKPFDLALRAKTDMKARAKFASGDWS